ncbi:MAG: hypothetical protein H6551_01725 [Chitinophagales bacterium]|nr:hypothetical protein [Chitinophagaceae bacterium]MCB9063844.1 hypothetical protein [Chitinophagales bacterium]
MARFIKNILKFVLVLPLFYLAYLLLVACSTIFTLKIEALTFTNTKTAGSNYQRTIDLDKWIAKTSKNKGLILGSSTAYKNINPYVLSERTGVDFFNNGSSSQCIFESAYLLDYVLENTEIEYLLLETFPGAWDMVGYETATDWVVNNYKPQRAYVFNTVKHANSLNLWLFYSYFYVKRSIPYTKDYLHYSPDEDNYKGLGFAYTRDSEFERVNSTYKSYDTISPLNKRSLERIINICREKNIKLILVMAKIFNADINKTILTQYDVPLIDCNNFQIDSTYYYDSHHMYGRGTDSFSRWLGDEFNQLMLK